MVWCVGVCEDHDGWHGVWRSSQGHRHEESVVLSAEIARREGRQGEPQRAGDHSAILTAMSCTSIHRVVVSQPRQGLRYNVVQTGRRKRLSFRAQLWYVKPLGRDKPAPKEDGRWTRVAVGFGAA